MENYTYTCKTYCQKAKNRLATTRIVHLSANIIYRDEVAPIMYLREAVTLLIHEIQGKGYSNNVRYIFTAR